MAEAAQKDLDEAIPALEEAIKVWLVVWIEYYLHVSAINTDSIIKFIPATVYMYMYNVHFVPSFY